MFVVCKKSFTVNAPMMPPALMKVLWSHSFHVLGFLLASDCVTVAPEFVPSADSGVWADICPGRPDGSRIRGDAGAGEGEVSSGGARVSTDNVLVPTVMDFPVCSGRPTGVPSDIMIKERAME